MPPEYSRYENYLIPTGIATTPRCWTAWSRQARLKAVSRRLSGASSS